MNDSADGDLLALITNEIDLGFTFLETARLSRDSGHNDHVKKAFLNAKKAWETGERFLGRLPQGDADFFAEKLSELRAALLSFETS